MRPLLLEAAKIRSPNVVERRVLSMVNPENVSPMDESTVNNISAAFQVLLPGEKARPHRHSMNALRFTLEGAGAHTIVDGKPCLMAEGDMILTPAWTWHEHEHGGDAPIIWLDVLDVPFHLGMGTASFEPGPAHDLPDHPDDGVFAVANFVPAGAETDHDYSPVFRYPRGDAVAALASAPLDRDGARRVRYANPVTGGPSMALLDSWLIEAPDARETVPRRTNYNSVFCVLDGEGESRIGEHSVAWQRNDIFTVPQGNWVSHKASGAGAMLFEVNDREIYRRLGILEERLGNAEAA
jgi:gentisate 1,2-dioxygenase